MHQTIEDNLNENPVQSIQNLTRAEGLPSNRKMDLNTQQEWLIDNSVDVLECPSLSLNLNLIKCFWGNLKMYVCLHRTWQNLRWKEVRRQIDNCQMRMSKSCHIQQKRLEAVKVLHLVKGMNTYAMYLSFLVLINKREQNEGVILSL